MKQGILDGCLQGIDDALQVCDVATALMLTLEFTGGVAVRVKRLVSRGFNYDSVGGFYGDTDARKTM